MVYGLARYMEMPWTAVTRSCRMLVISSGVKTEVVSGAEVTVAGDAEVIGAGDVGDPTVVIGAMVIRAVVPPGSVGVDDDDDMIEPESLDTKLVEPGILPDLLRRL